VCRHYDCTLIIMAAYEVISKLTFQLKNASVQIGSPSDSRSYSRFKSLIVALSALLCVLSSNTSQHRELANVWFYEIHQLR